MTNHQNILQESKFGSSLIKSLEPYEFLSKFYDLFHIFKKIFTVCCNHIKESKFNRDRSTKGYNSRKQVFIFVCRSYDIKVL